MLFTGCGTAKKAFPAVTPNPTEVEIERHLESDDISALVSDCASHPEYAGQIRQYLLYGRDYSATSYSSLLKYRDIVARDSILYHGFDAKVRALENQVYAHTQDMPLSSLMTYYESNRDYQQFLRPVVKDGLRHQIPLMEYKELRATKARLEGSDFEGMADSAYVVRRKAAEKAVTKSAGSIGKEEKSAVADLQTFINDSLTVYTAHAFQSVLRNIASKDLPSKQSSIDDLVQSSLAANFSTEKMQSATKVLLQDYQEKVNKARADYYLQLTGESIPTSALLDLSRVLPQVQYGKLGNMTPLYELSKIQNDVSLAGIGLGIAGMFLSGGLGLLVGAASMANSYHQGKDKAEKKKEYLSQFSKSCLPAMMGVKDKFTASLKKNISSEITRSQKAFLDAVHENY